MRKGRTGWISPEWSLEEGEAVEDAPPGGEESETKAWRWKEHSCLGFNDVGTLPCVSP